MSFPTSQSYLSVQRQRISHCSAEVESRVINMQQAEDFSNRVRNSICFILEACDSESISKQTKYFALSIFLKYLSNHRCSNDEEFGILVLCSLRLATKFNEAYPKSECFELCRYLQLIDTHRSISEILQFQVELFRQLNFKIYCKSPYHFLEELVDGRQLSLNFINSVSAYIDFALSLVEMVVYKAEQIFTGCLVALKKSRNIENKNIVGLIQQVCGKINKANQVGNIIIQAWKDLINNDEQEN